MYGNHRHQPKSSDNCEGVKERRKRWVGGWARSLAFFKYFLAETEKEFMNIAQHCYHMSQKYYFMSIQHILYISYLTKSLFLK